MQTKLDESFVVFSSKDSSFFILGIFSICSISTVADVMGVKVQ